MARREGEKGGTSSQTQMAASSSGERDAVLAAFAESLIESGRLDPAAWARAQGLRAETGERLDRLLVKLGLAPEAELAAALARARGLPVIGADDFPTEPMDLGDLSLDFLRSNEIAPIAVEAGRVRVAVVDPFDGFAAEALGAAMGLGVEVGVAASSDIRAHLDRLYGDGARAAKARAAGRAERLEEDVERLRDLASEAPVIRLVNDLIEAALGAGASDLHLEPEPDRLRVRLRVDGALRDHRSLPVSEAKAAISRVKIMARLDIAESRLPQDGRIKTAARGREIDLRVSTLPSIHGEAAVLRLLDAAGMRPTLSSLGLPEAEEARMRRLLEQPNGVLLVTGPTGSGKTTTLYGALAELSTEDRKILTVEDPVEYRLARAVQVQTKAEIGLGFAKALRSFLRHDPDVIMVGEIRDAETADIAVQAALTGHLVLSTLHTNSALGALVRLREMGVEDFLLGASIVGLAAQRLVRKLCPECRRPAPPPQGAWLGGPPPAAFDPRRHQLYEPVGCRACGGTGYRGRRAVIEVVALTEALRRALADGADLSELEAIARSEGAASLRDNALEVAISGETSLAEAARVAREF